MWDKVSSKRYKDTHFSGYFHYLYRNNSSHITMSKKYVIRLKNVAIYHADNPFGSTSEKKLLKQGEMVLSDVNLCVAPGEFVYLLGRVGSGKSTLLKTLYAEVQLLAGEGYIAGYDLRQLKRRDIPHLRRKIGIVFQDYQLLTDRNVFMNLYYVMKATGWKHESEIRERIDKVLNLVDLGAKSYKMPFELSGGEQQRLVIARALLNDPQVLLADEPTGNLDPVTADGIMQLFRKIADRGCAVVMSTHNTALIENYPARAILFSQGKISEVDLKAELA
jgi:predicted ATPase involved in cell division